jgi:hypothetical protein
MVKIKLKNQKYLTLTKVRLPGSLASRVPFVSTFLFLNKAPRTRTSVGVISWSFNVHTLEITHNTCTTPNEQACKRPRRIGASIGWRNLRFGQTSTGPAHSPPQQFVHSTPHSP